MRLTSAVPSALIALAVGAAVVPAAAAPAAPVVEHAASHVVRGDLGPARGSAASWALAALRSHGQRLGVDASAYAVESVRTSVLGTHVRGRQHRGGLPVDGTDFLVSAVDGRVVQVEARGTSTPGAPAARPVAAAAASAAAAVRLGVRQQVAAPLVRRLLAPRDGRLVDVQRVWVVGPVPAVAGVVDVESATGRVLAVRDERRFVDGEALVFDPNPNVSKRDKDLRQPGLDSGAGADTDLDSAVLTAQRRRLPLRGLDATALSAGRLSGPHVNVISAGYVATSSEPSFDLPRSDPRFEGLMAYAHVDRTQRWFQSLGFNGSKGVNLEPQEVVAVPIQGYDNSFYMPAYDLMALGAGGVDDGEDADVINHEYGHAVQDAQVPGWGDTAEGGAMGEGFGDFLAANVHARDGRGYHDACVAMWDATSYSDADPPCLRRTDGTKRYPDDVENQVHADGELWSALLWRVRKDLGRTERERSDSSMRLVLAHHELLTPQAEFGDAVAALRTAARALGKPQWAAAVDRAARATGMPRNPE